MPAPVPSSRNTGSDQDMHMRVNRMDTGAPRRAEEAGYVQEDLEFPGAEAVLQVVLLPTGATTLDDHPGPPARPVPPFARPTNDFRQANHREVTVAR